MKKKQKGFTLIELLVVIAVIGILASVLLPRVEVMREKGRDAKRITDIKTLQTALELYWDENMSYPLTANWENELVTSGAMPEAITDPHGVSYSYSNELPTYCIGINLERVSAGDAPPGNHDAACATILGVNYSVRR